MILLFPISNPHFLVSQLKSWLIDTRSEGRAFLILIHLPFTFMLLKNCFVIGSLSEPGKNSSSFRLYVSYQLTIRLLAGVELKKVPFETEGLKSYFLRYLDKHLWNPRWHILCFKDLKRSDEYRCDTEPYILCRHVFQPDSTSSYKKWYLTLNYIKWYAFTLSTQLNTNRNW